MTIEFSKVIQTTSGSRRRVRPGARMVRMVIIRLIAAPMVPMPKAGIPTAQ